MQPRELPIHASRVELFVHVCVCATVGAYIAALLNSEGPSVLALSRQTVPNLERSSAESVRFGAYTVFDSNPSAEQPDLVQCGLCVCTCMLDCLTE